MLIRRLRCSNCFHEFETTETVKCEECGSDVFVIGQREQPEIDDEKKTEIDDEKKTEIDDEKKTETPGIEDPKKE